MDTAKVYYADVRAEPRQNLLEKLHKLLVKAGIKEIDFQGKLVALKLHCGEPGNLAYIRPNYAARVAALVRELGGKPFLTDANTLYTGRRANAVDHLAAASENGFNRLATGCDFIVADGLWGTDYREIPISLKHCATAKIAAAIADADVLISLNHFKGHELTGFGGALKNIGMGSGSRGGKLEMHSASKPRIDEEKCTGCNVCVKNCSQHAITLTPDHKARIDYDLCIGCGQCVALCHYHAAQAVWNEAADTIGEKIAEYAFAVLRDKPAFHVTFITDVSPNCDCWHMNDAPIAPNLGFAASFDPVALDRACADLVNAAPIMPNSVLAETPCQPGEDKFAYLYPQIRWQVGLAHAEAIGLGTQAYELIAVK